MAVLLPVATLVVGREEERLKSPLRTHILRASEQALQRCRGYPRFARLRLVSVNQVLLASYSAGGVSALFDMVSTAGKDLLAQDTNRLTTSHTYARI